MSIPAYNGARQEDIREAEERAKDLRRKFPPDELRRLFITRERDTLFSYVGEPVTSPFKDLNTQVWNGYEVAIGYQIEQDG